MVKTNLDMDILRTLVVATDLGGFVRAADQLGRSQSAISLQMKKLEDQVGQQLFRKQGRGLALTDAGDVLLGYARRILELNDAAVSAAQGTVVEGSVRLGLPHDLAEDALRRILIAFAGAYPNIHIQVQIGRNRELRDLIGQGALDLALAFGDIDPSLEHIHFSTRLPVVWIGQGGQRPATADILSLALLDAPCMFRQFAIEALERSRQPWRIVFTTPSLPGLWSAIDAKLGITARTPLGLPAGLAPVADTADLPPLGTVELALYLASNRPAAPVKGLMAIVEEVLNDALPPGTAFW